jgi:hypothetical protein
MKLLEMYFAWLYVKENAQLYHNIHESLIRPVGVGNIITAYQCDL